MPAQTSTRYDPCIVSDDGNELIVQMREAAEALAVLFDKVESRCASVAKTHLETAVMFGTKAASDQYKDD